MEIRKDVPAPPLHQSKLWHSFRTVKHGGLVAKQEPFAVKQESDCAGAASASLVRSKASNMLFLSPRGVQSGYQTFPGAFRSAILDFQPAQTSPPAVRSLTFGEVKRELDVPIPLVDDSQASPVMKLAESAQVAVDDAAVANVTIVSEAIVNTVDADKQTEGGLTLPAGALSGRRSPHAVVDKESGVIPSSESVREVSKREFPEPDYLVAQTTAIEEEAAASVCVERKLGSVKKEATEEKLITALDMFEGGTLPCTPLPSSISAREAQAVPKVETDFPQASPKLMTALQMIPEEVRKVEETREHQSDVSYGGKSFLQPAKLTNSLEVLESVVLCVKREPVESPRENAAAAANLEEHTRRALQGRDTTSQQLIKNAVKLELPVSKFESGIFTDRKTFQASHVPTDSDYFSSGSDDTDDPEDAVLAETVMDGEGSTALLSNKFQKVDDCCTEKKHRNSNPGRRVQGGRLYDSAYGITCHWCRQKTVEPHVKCRECTIHYCGPCLLNRNGEKIRQELCDGVKWLCPKCRNGCGPGCDNCCNCGPCRKADGKTPTGQLVWAARNAGFENVHDYLVHLETGETPEVIAGRKEGREWTNCGRFECEDSTEGSELEDGDSSIGDGEEFTLNAETSSQLHEGKLGMKHVRRLVESQKRKRGAMRGAVQTKTTQHQGHTQPEDSMHARLTINGQGRAFNSRSELYSGCQRDEQLILPKAEPCTEECDLADSEIQERMISRPICKREFEEDVDGDGQDCRRAKRLKPGDVKADGFVGTEGSGQAAGGLSQEANISVSDTARGIWYKDADMPGKICGDQRCSLLEEVGASRSSLLNPFTDLVNHVTSNLRHKKEYSMSSKGNHCSAEERKQTSTGPRRKFTGDAGLPRGLERSHTVMDSELILKTRGVSILSGPKDGLSNLQNQLVSEQCGMESPTDLQGREYGIKLKSALAEQFDMKELEELVELVECRKPLQRIRHMRGRTVDVVTEDEGLSYLDHHQDLASRLADAKSPPEKLSLLRGFFFWLKHSCMEGSFKPWSLQAKCKSQSGDCIETDGPECQVTAVVLQLDECKDTPSRQKRKYKKKVQRPDQNHRGIVQPDKAPNALISGQDKQWSVLVPQSDNCLVQPVKPRVKKQTIQSMINYRVVLCLPAPALCKV